MSELMWGKRRCLQLRCHFPFKSPTSVQEKAKKSDGTLLKNGSIQFSEVPTNMSDASRASLWTGGPCLRRGWCRIAGKVKHTVLIKHRGPHKPFAPLQSHTHRTGPPLCFNPTRIRVNAALLQHDWFRGLVHAGVPPLGQ